MVVLCDGVRREIYEMGVRCCFGGGIYINVVQWLRKVDVDDWLVESELMKGICKHCIMYNHYILTQ